MGGPRGDLWRCEGPHAPGGASANERRGLSIPSPSDPGHSATVRDSGDLELPLGGVQKALPDVGRSDVGEQCSELCKTPNKSPE